MKIGYARVSTDAQSAEVQVDELSRVGCERIFVERASGSHTARPELSRLLRTLASGDSIVISRLDRLARSTRDLLLICEEIASKGCTLRSLSDPWIDMESAHGKLMLTVLGGLAEFERSLILARTSDGRKLALQKGVKFGRRSKLTQHQRLEALHRRQCGETLRQIAKSYNVSYSTISRLTPSSAGIAF